MDDSKNYEVVNFVNISSEPFVGIYGGKETTFAANKVTQLPRFLADHYGGQLATKLLKDTGKEYGKTAKERADILAKIIVDNPTGQPVMEVKAEETKPEEKEFVDLEEEEKSCKCAVCGKVYKTDAALKAHQTREHKTN